MTFRYNLSHLDTSELGQMYQVGKRTWPDESNYDAYQCHADYMDQVLDELLVRWACQADNEFNALVVNSGRLAGQAVSL